MENHHSKRLIEQKFGINLYPQDYTEPLTEPLINNTYQNTIK